VGGPKEKIMTIGWTIKRDGKEYGRKGKGNKGTKRIKEWKKWVKELFNLEEGRKAEMNDDMTDT
jgi:hypothetical protein